MLRIGALKYSCVSKSCRYHHLRLRFRCYINWPYEVNFASRPFPEGFLDKIESQISERGHNRNHENHHCVRCERYVARNCLRTADLF